jgi:hypothetical protein
MHLNLLMAYEIDRAGFRITLEHLGEGLDGDYDPTDPSDVQLLRFTAAQLVQGEWQVVEDGSACTALPTSITMQQGLAAAELIWATLHPLVVAHASVKSAVGRLSWLDPATLAAVPA